MKFFLNKVKGINNIDEASFNKIISTFGEADKIEIVCEEYVIDMGLIYEKIGLNLYFVTNFNNLQEIDYQTFHFIVNEIYLDNLLIKEGDKIYKILPKIKKYLRDNQKDSNYTIERKNKRGLYYFDNSSIVLFYEKKYGTKVIEKIDISYNLDKRIEIYEINKLFNLNLLEKLI